VGTLNALGKKGHGENIFVKKWGEKERTGLGFSVPSEFQKEALVAVSVGCLGWRRIAGGGRCKKTDN